MGELLVRQIDFNDPNLVNGFRSAIQKLVNNPLSYYSLKFKPPYYFEVPNSTLPSEGGWYIILDAKTPVYVGQANDLNRRLNSTKGSTDNFANRKRKADDKRNFVKKLDEVDIIKGLRVCIISEKDICSELGLSANCLTDLDRGNIEKLIDILRCYFVYK